MSNEHRLSWHPSAIPGYYTASCTCGKEWNDPTVLTTLYASLIGHKNKRPPRPIYRPAGLENPEFEG